MESVNLEKWAGHFESLEAEAEIMLDGLLLRAGWYMHRTASLREGHGGYMPYDTGTLQASLSFDGQVHRQGNTAYVAITTNVEYAPYQEYGWRSVSGRDIAGKGFMRYGARKGREYLNAEMALRVKEFFT